MFKSIVINYDLNGNTFTLSDSCFFNDTFITNPGFGTKSTLCVSKIMEIYHKRHLNVSHNMALYYHYMKYSPGHLHTEYIQRIPHLRPYFKSIKYRLGFFGVL